MCNVCVRERIGRERERVSEGEPRKRFEDVIYTDTKIAAVVIWRT